MRSALLEKQTDSIPEVSAMSTTTVKIESEQAPADSGPRTGHRAPLKYGGSLDQYEHFEVTPVIGREYPTLSIKDLLESPDADTLLRDLAIVISERGVVFFRKQDGLDNALQKQLVQRLGVLTGKPESSGLHIHPVANAGRRLGGGDDEISVISSVQNKELYADRFNASVRQSGKQNWHSDITFENLPSDYAVLRLTELPKTGGDTLWASGYELYDRISKPYRAFLDTLTATYAQPVFGESAAKNGFKLFEGPRGSPENVGTSLAAVHPVVRTNPVTGWRSVFAVGQHASKIDGVAPLESEHLLGWFVRLIVENHDLQVRFRWRDVNDTAVWDNRSTYHAITQDYADAPRTGQRAVSIGERPYFDPASTSRREALGL